VISKSLSRIQTSFQKLMNNISQLKDDMLDVTQLKPKPFVTTLKPKTFA
jgi:hypothetical protein